ncbi:hypothetical protein [Microbacterium imperiale]|uniref:Uncharacterized protein n=1 Tax=Microbacterium imperiale TaxID=33884 RepID=A0A9W6HH65_9MICO|nr:hypothetical protein [Microbacterium imperiale]MBP2422074.1 hypothetical protein [Microbacterium imperiale]MDS0200233.1 hypothetical protein [Microbacterium imperiale]BFE39385.1 hypothetical protein GCM10017544_03410 [Microbacterium imperiale]GLJ79748.1 hypothetical protein GCM10017586_14300 [Microbacterium imperiale]
MSIIDLPAPPLVSTMPIRLALEADADRLADLTAAALDEFYRLESLTAAARDAWRVLDLQRAAVERTLHDLPEMVPAAIKEALSERRDAA